MIPMKMGEKKMIDLRTIKIIKAILQIDAQLTNAGACVKNDMLTLFGFNLNASSISTDSSKEPWR